eukprot:5185303-Pyramimonas_sp.AAC.1
MQGGEKDHVGHAAAGGVTGGAGSTTPREHLSQGSPGASEAGSMSVASMFSAGEKEARVLLSPRWEAKARQLDTELEEQ